KAFVDIGLPLSDRGAQRAVNAYHAEYGGQMMQVNAHDLRRTYAKLCRDAGMEWEDLRDNLGHASVMTTEKYVGAALDMKKRKPKWAIEV
ncbi:MAG: site-specific integrase, partial [Burkholderiales bacterium]|nr:site-specific integrase [Anaerolineae bacterium]